MTRQEGAQAPLPGFAPVDATAEAIAAQARALAARRRFEPMAAGGLFDETERAQRDLF